MSQQIKQGAVGNTSGPFVLQCVMRAAQLLQGTKCKRRARACARTSAKGQQTAASDSFLVIYDGSRLEAVLM